MEDKMKGLRRYAFYLMLNALVIIMINTILFLLGVSFEDTLGLLVFCAIYGFAGSILSLLISKSLVKASYKVQLITPQNPDPRLRFVYQTVEAMARERGFKTPEVGVYPSRDVNAFATGASKNNSLVAVSSGMLQVLSDEELAAVLGHEITHISEGDMVSMTLVMGLVNTFVMFMARILAAVLDAALRGDKNKGGLGYLGFYLVYMVLQNVLMILAMIPVSYYSRHREYRADKGAAQLTGAQPMIEALIKIDRHYAPEGKQDSLALAKINNKRKMSLFATHPSIEMRVERLRNLR